MTDIHSESRSTGRPAWAEIDLGRLRGNYRALRSLVPPDVKLLAVIKADAYGHGLTHVARALENEGADALGVAIVEEGIELRDAGIRVPVLVFGGVFPGQEQQAVKSNLTPAIYTIDALKRLSDVASEHGRTAWYHLKIDTGMGRLGLRTTNLRKFMAATCEIPSIQLKGVFTQLSSADEIDQTYTKMQLDEFQSAIAELDNLGFSSVTKHAANSAGLLYHPDAAFDMVRAGLALYGVNPRGERDGSAVRPVMSLKSTIAFIKTLPAGSALGYSRAYVTDRDTLVATIPIGYADGMDRHMTNKGKVLVRGQIAPMIGAISMDSLLADVTDIPGADIGDEVVLIGEQGGHVITADEVAGWAATVPHDILCGISRRIPRIYVDRE